MDIGGWLIGDSFFCKLSLIPGLWTFTKEENGVPVTQMSLFFVGWYSRPDSVRMWTVKCLGLCLQVQFNFEPRK